MILRTAMPFGRCDGSVQKIDENAAALVEKEK